MANLMSLLNLVLAALVLDVVYGAINDVPIPPIDLNEWWGPGDGKGHHDTSIRKFSITFQKSMVTDLKNRLLSHRKYTPPLEGAAFNYGFNSTELEYWVNYLAKQYPFDEREKFLNKYPHYITNIQGLDIHFMRITSQRAADDTDDEDTFNKKLVPLMILHGWPGSIREFYETIPYLLSIAKSKGIALDIIVPSIPGFAYSDGAVRPGLGMDKSAIVLRNMMHRIGYTQYYVQGGDIGSITLSILASYFPTEVLGFHMNLAFLHTPDIIFKLVMGNLYQDEIASPDQLYHLYPSTNILFGLTTGAGYLHEQSTRPDTVGIGLTDSPSGLMSYTVEKMSAGGRRGFNNLPDGGLHKIFTPEQLMDNFMIYWSTNCITTSIRMYAETYNKRWAALRTNEIKSMVPAWAHQAPHESIYLPPWMIKQKFPNLLGETIPSDGGHFYAWERPQPFAEDVVNAIVQFRNWHAMNSSMYSQCSSYIDD